METKEIETKWQEKWEKDEVFKVEKNDKPKYYVLEMFPYPSSAGLHVGHAFNYTIGDVYARYKKLKGFNVLHPMGYDSFGLPAENAAIKANVNPKDYTTNSIANFIRQQKRLGITYDWSRVLSTSDEKFFKWDQWIFIQMFKKGLAYKKKSAVNWCPKCNTVLANEQVHNGKCWRHEDTDVEIKHLEQWYFKTTQYAEELSDFSKLEGWPSFITKLQNNWIGKSTGTLVKFNINNEDWEVFTTRPDTLMGVTFLVISAQHSRLLELTTKENLENVKKFVKKQNSVSSEDIDKLEKEGIFTGSYAIHPLTNEKVPVYAGNFVLADYGSGVVMGVPTHDKRDFEFAKKYNIPMKVVITPKNKILKVEDLEDAFIEDGILINSNEFDGLENRKAIKIITNKLKELGKGKDTVNYRLRDWLISRQRYWGTPIPVITCPKCGDVCLEEKDLPLRLPTDVEFGKGNPLETSKSFVNTICPKCGAPAKRVTDTMDTFVNSSWYNLRYADPQNDKEIFNKELANYWNPIDLYIGGKEHACMHLIYFRFYTKFLRDLGLVNFDEPALKLFNQGMVHGNDGNKMSKSLGNTVDVTEIIDKFGADVLRLYVVSVAGPESNFNWDDKGLDSTARFVNKVKSYFESVEIGKSNERTDSRIHTTLKQVDELIEQMKYNIAIIKLRELFESFETKESKENLEIFLKMFSLFCPHIAEEMWNNLGNKTYISKESWPILDESKINPDFDFADKYIENTRLDILQVQKLVKIEKINKIELFVAQKWKYDLYDKIKELLLIHKNPNEIIPKIMQSDLKVHGQEVMKILPKIIKTGSLPEYISFEKEFELIEEIKENIEKEFDCKVEIIKSDDSKEQKAKQSMPGKPAIIIS
ncbi:MAG: leucine--tRNA ligase [Candidatus Nanoarchaeia archaeon]|nr:leucine--tRNA ligase [Candidatus Nanoarchaeia archaeon]